MKPSCRYTINVFATGFVVLVLLSIPLFWTRFLYETLLAEGVRYSGTGCEIRPSGLVPDRFENDPNVALHSRFWSDLHIESSVSLSLGASAYMISKMPGGDRSDLLYLDDMREWAYFDRGIGLIRDCSIREIKLDDDSKRRVRTELYIGPDGISEKPDKALGRFKDPLVTDEGNPFGRATVIYDRTHRCFYKVDTQEEDVVKGPQLPKDDTHRPIQIGYRLAPRIPFSQLVLWEGPQKEVPDKYDPNRPGKYEDITRRINQPFYVPSQTRHLLVLDASGRIDLLDIETLEFAGTAGQLPTPRSLYPSESRARPEDVLELNAEQIVMATDAYWEVLKDRDKRNALPPEDRYNKYLGMAVACTSREGTSQTLAVFDPNGKLIETDNTEYRRYVGRRYGGQREETVSSAESIYFDTPWAPVYTITKYLVENLHPPLLSAASFFTASTFEAGSGHRSLFFVPNSFIAMQGRHTTQDFFSRTSIAFLFMAPGFILSLLLAYAVGKDARRFGFADKTRQLWIIATVALGLPAYITYRLTRPKIALVTCQGCGQGRRPDQKTCHRCNSPWNRPDLDAPTWRVLASS